MLNATQIQAFRTVVKAVKGRDMVNVSDDDLSETIEAGWPDGVEIPNDLSAEFLLTNPQGAKDWADSLAELEDDTTEVSEAEQAMRKTLSASNKAFLSRAVIA